MAQDEKKRILVTGGAGYVGSALVPALLARGYAVRVVDALIFGASPLAPVSNRIELIKGDMRDIGDSLFDGIFAVIHLAGFSTEPTAQYDPRLTDMLNHIVAERLASTAKKKGVERFLYASTCSVYFTFHTPLEPPLYKETEEVNPISAYSLTKRCGEQALLGLVDSSFHPIILRKGTLYGSSPRMRYDLVLNSFAKDAFYKKCLTIDAGGEIWRPMIDIADVVNIYIKALELPAEKIGGKIFNIADQNWNIGELARFVRDTLKKEKGIDISLDVKSYGIARNYKVDTSLFKETFGFHPSRTMREALFEMWSRFEHEKDHNPHNDIYYGDKWYKKFFETEEGKKFREI
ncbi:MAG: SDR family oxidoreductase [Candidatus Niyogibacteria bacterium]|nr:SDR family oxidoreductase [Candidatus Niyogibacteria bacterium]